MKSRSYILTFSLVMVFAWGCSRVHPDEVAHANNAFVEPSDSTAQETVRLKAAHILQVERANGLESSDVRFGTITFSQAMKTNDLVTLVPLGVQLPNLQTRVANVTVSENPCSESLPKIFDVELEPVTDAAWLKMPTPFNTEKRFSENAPFEICVLYPAVKQARALNRGLLQPNKLPRRVLLQNILLALDTSGDDLADVLVVEFCCDKPALNRHNCDLTCKNVYQRDAKGNWVIVDKQTPC